MTSPPIDFGLGVIEGFFGRTWSRSDRVGYADFLETFGFDFYIYAPKADSYLRRRWQEPWPDATSQHLSDVAETYRAAGVSFGIGISPYEIFMDFGAAAKAQLRTKIAALNAIGPDILCVLFDDMRGDIPNLARLQADIVRAIAETSTAGRLVMCPTYYSYDPKLDQDFGARPPKYLTDLGRQLDPHVAIFWTGPLISPNAYPAEHFREIADTLRRKPVLWDNHLANDGANSSNYLHFDTLSDHLALPSDLLMGHAINPMNQAWLSRIPLLAMSNRYRDTDFDDPTGAFARACRSLCSDATANRIIADAGLFQNQGLAGISGPQHAQLIREYSQLAGDPYAKELVAWLNGEYAFDPASLTD